MTRKLLIPLTIGGVCLAILLGNQFWPFVKSVRESAAEQVLALADQQKLKLHTAKQALEQFKTQIARMAEGEVRVKHLVGELDGKKRLVQTRVKRRESQLVELQEKLVQSQPIFTSTGRSVGNGELESLIQQHRRGLESDRAQLESLEKMRDIASRRQEYLAQACETAPARLQDLKNEIGLLEEKLDLVANMKSWQLDLGTETATGPTADEWIETLHKLGRDVDAEIAGLDALMGLEFNDGSTGALAHGPSTEDLIASIQQAVAE